MQLIDNLYLKNIDHTLTYKIKQAKLAQQLYNRHSKNWILDSYLNVVPYGTVGVDGLRRRGCVQAVLRQARAEARSGPIGAACGYAAGAIRIQPVSFSKLARERRAHVLQAMVQSHYITRAQAAAANAEPLQARHSSLFGVKRLPYVFDYVVQELHQRFCPNQPVTKPCAAVDAGGLRVYTTIQPSAEAEAQRAILAHEGGPGQACRPRSRRSIQPTVTSWRSQTPRRTPTRASTTPRRDCRQPGSAFKVFALMTLIHDYDGSPSKTFYNSHFRPPAGCRASRPGRSIPPRRPTRGSSTSPRRRSSPTTPFSPSSSSISGWGNSTGRRTPWASPQSSTAIPPR